MTHKGVGILLMWTTGLSGVMTAATARICLWRDEWGPALFTALGAVLMLRLSFKVARALERFYPGS